MYLLRGCSECACSIYMFNLLAKVSMLLKYALKYTVQMYLSTSQHSIQPPHSIHIYTNYNLIYIDCCLPACLPAHYLFNDCMYFLASKLSGPSIYDAYRNEIPYTDNKIFSIDDRHIRHCEIIACVVYSNQLYVS